MRQGVSPLRKLGVFLLVLQRPTARSRKRSANSRSSLPATPTARARSLGAATSFRLAILERRRRTTSSDGSGRCSGDVVMTSTSFVIAKQASSSRRTSRRAALRTEGGLDTKAPCRAGRPNTRAALRGGTGADRTRRGCLGADATAPLRAGARTGGRCHSTPKRTLACLAPPGCAAVVARLDQLLSALTLVDES